MARRYWTGSVEPATLSGGKMISALAEVSQSQSQINDSLVRSHMMPHDVIVGVSDPAEVLVQNGSQAAFSKFAAERAIFSTADASPPGVKCAYRSAIVISACPRSSRTEFRSTPD